MLQVPAGLFGDQTKLIIITEQEVCAFHVARQFLAFEAPAIAYITVAVLTATTFVFAGYMREQVCTYMCPWPRIQAAMPAWVWLSDQ